MCVMGAHTLNYTHCSLPVNGAISKRGTASAPSSIAALLRKENLFVYVAICIGHHSKGWGGDAVVCFLSSSLLGWDWSIDVSLAYESKVH